MDEVGHMDDSAEGRNASNINNNSSDQQDKNSNHSVSENKTTKESGEKTSIDGVAMDTNEVKPAAGDAEEAMDTQEVKF